jgi:hypothetical protein
MSGTLKACRACEALIFEGTCVCPHCGDKAACYRSTPTAAAALLGLSMLAPGCFKDVSSDYTAAAVDDTGSYADDTGEGGVDRDNDGWSVNEGDCDDDNPDIHPEAEEIPDDGVDSDCDGEDNPVDEG